MKNCLSCFCSLILMVSTSFSQKEHNIWYFGNYAGLDFNSGSPVAITDGAINTVEGCASVADSLGKLLFYTDGIMVWNKNHTIMPNGAGLLGNISTTQSAIIVPNPANDKKYYVFTLDVLPITISTPNNGVHYSEVDMSLQGGLGDVSLKNINLLSVRTTEKLTAVRHANGTDFWVIAHEIQSNAFHAFKVTAAGVSATAVISNTGSFHNGIGPVMNWQFQGYLKASPDGKKLVNGLSHSSSGFIELFDFNSTTGVVSNPVMLLPSGFNGAYGVEFSPNSKVLYARGWGLGIYQYDLGAGSAAAIVNSGTLISPPNTYAGALQLGPDNKIYCTGGFHVSVINSPNSLGTGCDFAENAIYLEGKLSSSGLPNFLPRIQPPYLAHKGICFGDTTFFSFNDSSIVHNALWNFGDPASGAANQSTIFTPYHIFSDTGVFRITAVIDFTSHGSNIVVHDTLRDTVHILPFPVADLGPDTSICQGDSIVYNASFTASTYFWQNTTEDSVLVVKSPGYYSVIVKNVCGIANDAVNVKFIPPLKQPYDFNDTVICKGNSFRIYATQAGLSYRWQDNTTKPFYDVSGQGTYWVEWQNACESVSDTFIVSFLPELNLDLGNDTTICFGDKIQLNAVQPQPASYRWQDASGLPTFSTNQAGIYWVSVSNACEERSDSIIVSLRFPPDVYLGEDTTLCRYNTLILDAKNEGASYLWQDGSTGRYMQVKRESNYWVDVKNDCAITNDSLLATLTYPPKIDLGDDTVICTHSVMKLDASYKASSYRWQDGSENAFFYVGEAGAYKVEVRNACGIKNDEIIIGEENCECTLFAPDAFTPNSDQLNDVFGIYQECAFIEYELTIFNRWGEIVYQSNNPAAGWDGTLSGNAVPADAYVWNVRYVAAEGSDTESKTLRGLVRLIR